MKKKRFLKAMAFVITAIVLFSVLPITEFVFAAQQAANQPKHLTPPQNEQELEDMLAENYFDDQQNTDLQALSASVAPSAAILSTGTVYYIRNKTSGKYLTASNIVDDRHVNIGQWEFTSGLYQRWKFIDVGDGYYKLACQWNSDMVLDVKANLTANGSELQIYPNEEAPSERFKFKPLPDGSYQILSGLTQDQRCVSNDTGSTESGETNLHLWDIAEPAGDGIDNQSWYLEPVREDGEISDAPADGQIYNIRARHSGHIWGMAEEGGSDGTVVYQMYRKQTNSQYFKFERAGDDPGCFYICPRNAPGKVLQLSDKMAGDYHRIEAFSKTGSDIQKFQFTKTSDGSYQISPKTLPGYAMQIVWDIYAPEISTLAAPYSGESNQQWILEHTQDLSADPQEGSFYHIRAKHSGQIWGLAENGEADGTVVWQMYQKYWGGQVFSFKPVAGDSGYYYICPSSLSDKVMQLSDKMVFEHHRIETAAQTGEDKQKFKLIQNANGTYRIVPKLYPDDAIETAWESQETEISVMHTPYEGKASQQWMFEETSNPRKLTIKAAKTAVFEDQNVKTIENEEQLIGSFDEVTLLVSESAQRLGGFLTFHDGNTTESYLFMHYICQSHMDLTGKRSLIAGATNYPSDQGYVLTSFRIEENCDSLTLMPTNLHLKGKTVVSIGLLNKSTNKMYYMQQEITGISFDALYQKAVSKGNDYAFRSPVNTALLAENLNSSDVDLGEETEKAYLFLKQQSGVEAGEFNNAEPGLSSDPTFLVNTQENSESLVPTALSEREQRSVTVDTMRKNLKILQDVKVATTDSNNKNYRYLSNMAAVSYPLPHRWIYRWIGFDPTDSKADIDNRCFYAIYGSQLAGTDNNIATVMLVDFRYLNQGMEFSMSAEVIANMDIAYNTKTKLLTVWESTRGNAVVDNFFMGQHIISTNKNLKYTNTRAKTKVTKLPTCLDLIGLANMVVGVLGFGGEAADLVFSELTNVKQLYDAMHVRDSKPIGPNVEHIVSGACSHNTVVCRFGHLYAPDGKIGPRGERTNSDFATLTGTVSVPGYYMLKYLYGITVATVVYGKYDY